MTRMLSHIVFAAARFCYDFVIGDDWRITAGAAGVLTAGAAAVATGLVPESVIGPLVAFGHMALFVAILARTGARS
jgi:hypothetical protein